MISAGSVWRWAAVSNERARVNARAAATECSRRRVERAEVERFLVEQRRPVPAEATALRGQAGAR